MGRRYHDEGWLDTLAEVEAIRAGEAGALEEERERPTPDEYWDDMTPGERAQQRQQDEERKRRKRERERDERE